MQHHRGIGKRIACNNDNEGKLGVASHIDYYQALGVDGIGCEEGGGGLYCPNPASMGLQGDQVGSETAAPLGRGGGRWAVAKEGVCDKYRWQGGNHSACVVDNRCEQAGRGGNGQQTATKASRHGILMRGWGIQFCAVRQKEGRGTAVCGWGGMRYEHQQRRLTFRGFEEGRTFIKVTME